MGKKTYLSHVVAKLNVRIHLLNPTKIITYNQNCWIQQQLLHIKSLNQTSILNFDIWSTLPPSDLEDLWVLFNFNQFLAFFPIPVSASGSPSLPSPLIYTKLSLAKCKMLMICNSSIYFMDGAWRYEQNIKSF